MSSNHVIIIICVKKKRMSRIDNCGAEKKSMLLKPGFSAKKSISSDNLSKNDPKQWPTSKNATNTLVRSATSLNMTGFHLVASTPCVTPGFKPNLPGINSSYKYMNSLLVFY